MEDLSVRPIRALSPDERLTRPPNPTRTCLAHRLKRDSSASIFGSSATIWTDLALDGGDKPRKDSEYEICGRTVVGSACGRPSSPAAARRATTPWLTAACRAAVGGAVAAAPSSSATTSGGRSRCNLLTVFLFARRCAMVVEANDHWRKRWKSHAARPSAARQIGRPRMRGRPVMCTTLPEYSDAPPPLSCLRLT